MVYELQNEDKTVISTTHQLTYGKSVMVNHNGDDIAPGDKKKTVTLFYFMSVSPYS